MLVVTRLRGRRSGVPLAALAVALVGAACSSGRGAIRADDPAFARAEARLVRTRALVDASGASDGERALFLQAEGFYRYRFAPSGRGAASYLAEGAAAVADLPALQSLAGALDLAEIRLRASDGAVHLWETLLQHHPTTPLRPLALYRLGWAYRSTGASGLPRDSGDEAFDLLLHESPGSPLAPLAREAKRTPGKSKHRATALSLVPGLGQMYVGEYGSGAARLAIALASAAAVVAPVVVALVRRQDLTFADDWPLVVTGLAGVVVLSWDYTSSYDDALRGVVQWNERREAEFEDRHPEAP